MNGSLFAPVIFLGVFALALTAQARTPVYVPGDEAPTACTMQYQPVCGAKEVQCVRAPCYPQYQTYGNSCMMAADHATLVHEGECTPAETGPVTNEPYVPPAHCTAWFDGCNQCGRGENGESYCTLKACVGNPAPGYCITYDEPSQEEPPQPAPAQEESAATSSASVAEEAPQGFFTSLWQQIARFLSNLF